MKHQKIVIMLLLISLFLSCTNKEAREILPFYFNNGKWGFINENYETVIDPIYDDIWYAVDGKAVVMKDSLCGLINKDNKLLMPIKYDYIRIFSEKIAVGRINKQSHIYNMKTNKLRIINCETAVLWDNKLLIMADSNEKVCLYHIDKDSLQQTEYDDIVMPRASIYLDDNNMYFVSQIKANNQYLNKDIAVVVKDKKMGHIDIEGKEIFEPQFDYAFLFQSGISIIMKNKKWGLVNRKGEIIVEPKYQSIHFDEETYLAGSRHNVKMNYGYNEYFGANYVDYGLIVVKENDMYGLIDTNGKVVLKPFYKEEHPIIDGQFVISLLIAKEKPNLPNWNIINEKSYNQCWYYNDSLVWFNYNNKFGLATYKGKIIWQKEGDIEFPIINAVIAVIGKKYCIIDSKGSFIEKTNFEKAIPPLIDHGDSYHFSFINDDSIVCFDAYGNRLFKLKGKNFRIDFFCFPDSILHLLKIDINDKYGRIDKKGNIIIPAEYAGIDKVSDEFYIAYPDKLSNDDSNSDSEEVRPFYIQAKTNKRSKRIMRDPGELIHKKYLYKGKLNDYRY